MSNNNSNGKYISCKELAGAFNVSIYKFKNELKLIPGLQLRPMQRLLSPKQIAIIKNHLGDPYNEPQPNQNNMQLIPALSKCCNATVKVKYKKLSPGSKLDSPDVDFWYCLKCLSPLDQNTLRPEKRNGIHIMKP